MSEWTPGPWTVTTVHGAPNRYFVRGEDASFNNGLIIASAGGPDAEANTRLIAEAPAMARILKQIIHGDVEEWTDPIFMEGDALLKRLEEHGHD